MLPESVPDAAFPLLEVTNLVAGYGNKPVVNGVSLHVAPGEIVALIGHNGAGKSTLLKSIFGLLLPWSGAVKLNGRAFSPPCPRDLRRAGAAFVPQGNRVFNDLTVRENLDIAGMSLPAAARLESGTERVLALFPFLAANPQRHAGTLSGGEKQMLALASALISSPRLLLLDEPSLGLAPPLIVESLQRIAQVSRESGASALIVEQKVREVLKIADRVYVLRNGAVAFSGLAADLQDDAKLREVYL